ncbi:MAG: winged helix-turn-helix domain-containing protein [Acidobacteriota bacterium]
MDFGNDLQVADWLVQPELNRIAGHNGEHQVEPKVMQVLLLLARRPGAVSSRDEILAEVWPDTVVVESTVFRAISELRRIFDDDAKHPQVIATVRKRGYRLIAPVQTVVAKPQPDETAKSSQPTPFLRQPIAAGAPTRRGRFARATLWSALVLALAGTAAVRFRATDNPPPSRTPSWPEPPTVVASSPDLEFSPALSPDGRGVAYVLSRSESRRDEVWKIHLKLPGDTAARVLNPDPFSECSPAWSPDGQSIAFWRFTQQHTELVTTPVLGGPMRRLARAQPGTGRDTSWSPDGRWLAGSGRAEPNGPRVILLAAAVGTPEVRQLTQPPSDWYGDISPAIAPDGKSIAFVRSSVSGREQDIYLIPTAGGPVRRLTFDRKPIRGITWRNDGEHLIFSSKRSHRYALWQLSIHTGDLTWTGIYDARSPAASRAEDQLAYQHTEGEINIWQADLSLEPQTTDDPAPERRRELIRSTRTDRAPHHRPDGGAIAFSSDRTGHFEIWTSDADGGNPRQMTRYRQFTSRPRFSPDSRRLAFQGDIDGNHDIYVIDGLDHVPRRLTHHPATDEAPSWSHDGHWIYFASIRSGVWQVWKIASGGGEAIQVTHDGGYTAHASADGQWLYTTRSTRSGLWRQPTQGGPTEQVLERFRHRTLNGWALVGDTILYSRFQTGGSVLVAFDPQTSSERLLTSVPTAPGLELSVSSDLKSVLFTRMDRRASDIYQVRLPAL